MDNNTNPASRCWACGQPTTPPTLHDQIRELAELHYQQGLIFHWSPEEFVALESMLLPGDVLLSLLAPRRPTYSTVRVIRASATFDITRRQIQARLHEIENGSSG
jgi:hypothetical protein